ncbi:MAG: V-type ATP synthase subunit D [Candidatus Omnitrophica bacterium]|nr:V-type ATP synthase subunit D [Candidatus Omnitrophota bacterium]
MRLKVNPNRMELLKLKRRIILASRGHKLLKNKLDELIRLFLGLIKELRQLQEELDLEIKDAFLNLLLARAQIRKKDFQEIPLQKENVSIDFSTRRLMNLTLPSINIAIKESFSYDFINTPGQLDIALLKFLKLLPNLIRLAQLYKSCQIFSFEIERTRRRTNALEYILIPSLKETIDYITRRLSEFERDNLTRLMRIKEFIQ